MVGEERDIRGSYLGSGVPAQDIAKYTDHLASGSSLRDCIVL